MLKNSVQKRFFLISAPLALVALLAVALWSAKTGHDKQTVRLNEKLEHLIQNQTLVMAEAIADRDDRLLKLVGAGLVADPDIVFVHIKGQAGEVVTSLGKADSTDFRLERQINVRQGDRLTVGGSLTLGVTYDAVRETSFRSLTYSTLGALVAVIAIWLGGFLAFRHTVGRPIDTLHQLIARWRSNQWEDPAGPIAKDEFGALTSAFVDLHQIVQTREVELQAVKDGLERRVAERTEELEKRAVTDVLTGLPNRRAATKFAREELKQTDIDDKAVAVFAIDLDHFKQLNDQQGHAVGDEMLRSAARIIETHMGPTALVARMGGDEFVAIVPCSGVNAKDLEDLGRELVAKLSAPVTLDGIECQIGACVGVAVATRSGQSFEQLLANADLALYDAKHAGRSRSKLFDEKIHTAYRHRRKLVEEIKLAISREEFEPYLQPQINLDTGATVGFELLARWRRSSDELVLPNIFLPAVEDAGLTAELDALIMRKGLDALVTCRKLGHRELRMSANASTASLQQEGYSAKVLKELKKRGLKPSDLVVEILEETVITNASDQAVRSIQALSEAGVGIEMDDFGAGYSSFSQLALLPLDGLKIDRMLIDPLPNGPSVGIVRAILALCKELNLRVISEGVETRRQLETLNELGCDMAQGYLVARPMSISQAILWLNGKEGAKATSAKLRKLGVAA